MAGQEQRPNLIIYFMHVP